MFLRAGSMFLRRLDRLFREGWPVDCRCHDAVAPHRFDEAKQLTFVWLRNPGVLIRAANLSEKKPCIS
jgi:hypothetical protein